MKKFFNDFSTPKKLGFFALTLGFFAVFGGNPYDNAVSRIDSKDLSLIVENKADHITVDELADWIISGKSDYRLIDLNEPSKFAEYHIPPAENIKLTDLPDSDILKNEKIILYSDGGIHASQAWMLMKAKGYKSVYTLSGGLEEWKESVLFPSLPENFTPEDSLQFEKKKEISLYFGGVPPTGSRGTGLKPSVQLPKIQLPAGTSPGSAPKKKKKEGC